MLKAQAFIDKALAFPAINFRFIQDGKLKDFFPTVSTKKERFAAAILQAGDENFLHEINVKGTGFSAAIVIGGPELYRNDRRQLFVFANGRKVQDYSLIQAMEYGSQGWFPNGTHPVGAVYVEIDPSLADFNIHPAKREVRFRDSGAIHHAVTSGLKSFFHNYFLKNSQKEDSHGDTETQRGEGEFKFSYNRPDTKIMNDNERFANYNSESMPNRWFEAREKSFEINLPNLREKLSEKNSFVNESSPVYGKAKYAGRIFGLFILIEWGDKLYIIDQHAAHERILYNSFLSQPVPKQELLAPIPFCTESDEEDAFLEAKREELSRLGVDMEKDEDNSKNNWRIEALPANWRLGDAATVKEILELRTAGENMAERWAATLCCREAIKDGDYPDDETAFAIGKEALNLPDPRCPHGRPIWTEISKDALFKAVRRN